MPFDPTKPANKSKLSSAEMRDQLNALKALIDAQAAQIATLTAQVADLQSQLNQKVSMTDVNTAIQQGASANSNNVITFTDTFSDPPTEAEMQALVDKLNELINQLRQPS